MAASPLGRREVLGWAAGLTAGVALLGGCTLSDPTVQAPTTPASTSATRQPTTPARPTPTTSSSTPAPSPAAALTAPARTEQSLAALAEAISTGPHRGQLSSAQRRLLDFVTGAHHNHVLGLVSPAPTVPAPSLKKLTLKQSLRLLARRESEAARAHRGRALAARGELALILGSMSVAASTFATEVDRGKPGVVRRLPLPPPLARVSDVAAAQELVRQLHAVVYGYQLAIGQLKVTSSAHTRAVKELLAARKLRDALIRTLDARSAEVPAAAPAYVPSVMPRDPASAGRLLRDVQTRLEPFCGLALAAGPTPADRERALDALTATVDRARGWGSVLQAWPGRSV